MPVTQIRTVRRFIVLLASWLRPGFRRARPRDRALRATERHPRAWIAWGGDPAGFAGGAGRREPPRDGKKT